MIIGRPTSQKPHLTPDTQSFVTALAERNAPPLYILSHAEAREVLLALQAATSVEKADATIRDLELPVGPTGSVPTRIVRPKNAVGPLPFIVYLHGGGWVMGNRETHDRLIRELAVGTGAAVVFPEYTLSPETRYPIPLEQAYAVLIHMAAHAGEYDLAADNIILAGDSVGGNMATVLCLMARDRKGPSIAFQLLFYPVTNAEFDTESYKDFADGPWLTREAMKWFWDAYLPEENKRRDITVSPLRAGTGELRHLPPALIITAENDVLRDEGEAYGRKLLQDGVPVACMRCNGTVHDFVMLNALADTPPARAAMLLAIEALKTFLKQ